MSKFLIIGLLFITIQGQAQPDRFLLFEKTRNRRAYYYPGDVVSFRVQGSDEKVTGTIQALQDSIILLDYFRINVNTVTHIYVDDKQKFWYGFRYKLEPLLLIAGAGYLALDVINTQEFNQGTLLISGSLLSAGLLMRWLTRDDKTRIRGRRRLEIVSL